MTGIEMGVPLSLSIHVRELDDGDLYVSIVRDGKAVFEQAGGRMFIIAELMTVLRDVAIAVGVAELRHCGSTVADVRGAFER